MSKKSTIRSTKTASTAISPARTRQNRMPCGAKTTATRCLKTSRRTTRSSCCGPVRILAHTHEFIGIRAHGGACEVKSRSSWGRNGVAVCFDAGWIDPGYINRITLEIYNLNRHESVILPVGERIGQLIFHKSGIVEGDYSDGRDGMSGKYQHTDDLDELIATWSPEQMLPRSYKDTRKVPLKIKGLPEGTK